jgi:hypothetical protein
MVQVVDVLEGALEGVGSSATKIAAVTQSIWLAGADPMAEYT